MGCPVGRSGPTILTNSDDPRQYAPSLQKIFDLETTIEKIENNIYALELLL